MINKTGSENPRACRHGALRCDPKTQPPHRWSLQGVTRRTLRGRCALSYKRANTRPRSVNAGGGVRARWPRLATVDKWPKYVVSLPKLRLLQGSESYGGSAQGRQRGQRQQGCGAGAGHCRAAGGRCSLIAGHRRRLEPPRHSDSSRKCGVVGNAGC
jgi:hypothetical protein